MTYVYLYLFGMVATFLLVAIDDYISFRVRPWDWSGIDFSCTILFCVAWPVYWVAQIIWWLK